MRLRRACPVCTAAAFLLFCLNVIGGGLAPFMVGLLSDLLEPSLRAESLRYAMMGLAVGTWLMPIGIAVFVVAIVGWVYEYYRGYFAR